MLEIGHAHVPAMNAGGTVFARCWKIAPRSTLIRATPWRYTDWPYKTQVLEEGGWFSDYWPQSIAWAGTHRERAEFADNTSELLVVLNNDGSSDRITVQDCRSGLLDDAVVTEYWIQPEMPFLPPRRSMRWRIADQDLQDGLVRFDLVGLSSELRRTVGIDLGPRCRNDFGDPICTWGNPFAGRTDFDFRTYRVGTSPNAPTPTRRSFRLQAQTSAFPTQSLEVTNWWARGVIEFQDGPNKGVTGVIRANSEPVSDDGAIGFINYADFVMATPLAYAPEPGNYVRLRVGCDGAWSTCRDKFGNTTNFLGWKDMPGTDFQIKSPDAE